MRLYGTFVRRPGVRGFSLLELCMLLALTGALAVIGLSSLRSRIGEARLTQAAARVAGALVQSRAGAIQEDRVWRISLEGNSLQMHAGDRGLGSLRMPAGVRVTLNSNGDVRFHPDGHAENGTFRLISAFGEKTVVLNQRGRIRWR
jgi:type II secretory pathway pseudopilin PulG